MGERMQNVLIMVSALGCGVIAGVFFAFSSFIMGALGKLPPTEGISAMQSINIVVINPLFMGVLFGTAALSRRKFDVVHAQTAKARDWSQLVLKAHEQDAEPPPSEDEIVEQVRRDREARYRETYGRGA